MTDLVLVAKALDAEYKRRIDFAHRAGMAEQFQRLNKESTVAEALFVVRDCIVAGMDEEERKRWASR